jgi:hypothetical protein
MDPPPASVVPWSRFSAVANLAVGLPVRYDEREGADVEVIATGRCSRDRSTVIHQPNRPEISPPYSGFMRR